VAKVVAKTTATSGSRVTVSRLCVNAGSDADCGSGVACWNESNNTANGTALATDENQPQEKQINKEEEKQLK